MEMQSPADGAAVAGPAQKRARDYLIAGWASMARTTIEWYDFLLYGTAAALVFNKIFFLTLDPIPGALIAFATYGIGFIGRPMGGIAQMIVTALLAAGALVMWSSAWWHWVSSRCNAAECAQSVCELITRPLSIVRRFARSIRT